MRIISFLLAILMAASCGHKSIHGRIDGRVDDLLSQMTLQEKIGQLNQLSLMDGFSEDVVEQIEAGMVGSILNEAPGAVCAAAYFGRGRGFYPAAEQAGNRGGGAAPHRP